MPERHVDLGRATRATYFHGQPLEIAAPEIREMGLTGRDVEKIDRGIHIAIASNDMVERADVLAGVYPPHGLAMLSADATSHRVSLENLDLGTDFAPVKRIRSRHPGQLITPDFQDDLRTRAHQIADTMYLALIHEFLAGNPAVVGLPNPKDGQFGEPTHDIHRGIRTAADVMSNLLDFIAERYELHTGEIPTYGVIRHFAQRSVGIVSQHAALNVDKIWRISLFRNTRENQEYEELDLDLDKERVVLVQPKYDSLAHMPSLHPEDVTTGCPARIPLVKGKPSPIQRIYTRFVDLVT